ncbi:hypothetical protein F4802DRAFT_619605 [Xylaria palmicola]|nr:hypothetical protein F4802DRAFT_619605 [Xylaria palmicola]
MILTWNTAIWAVPTWALLTQVSTSWFVPAGISIYTNVSSIVNSGASNGTGPDRGALMDTAQSLVIGDPCSGLGSTAFELGREYGEADCPPLNDFLPDGTCDWAKKQPDQTKCAYYCQVRTSFLPMQEVPIPNTYCRGPRRCSIPAGRALQVDSLGWSGSEAVMSALEHGVSGGFDPGQHGVWAGAGDVAIGEGECGYFTWIGTRKSVCGSLTEATRHEPINGGSPYCQGPAKTTANYCVDDIYGGPLRNPSEYGHTVFVRVDCDSRIALPVDQQDSLFKYDGVAMSAERLDAILESWVTTQCQVHNLFLWGDFEMRGRGLKDSDVGLYGARLLEKMRACHAAVTDWRFSYTPDDNDYDWMASGSVDPFDLQCPGNALMDVGARYRDGC